MSAHGFNISGAGLVVPILHTHQTPHKSFLLLHKCPPESYNGFLYLFLLPTLCMFFLSHTIYASMYRNELCSWVLGKSLPVPGIQKTVGTLVLFVLCKKLSWLSYGTIKHKLPKETNRNQLLREWHISGLPAVNSQEISLTFHLTFNWFSRINQYINVEFNLYNFPSSPTCIYYFQGCMVYATWLYIPVWTMVFNTGYAM